MIRAGIAVFLVCGLLGCSSKQQHYVTIEAQTVTLSLLAPQASKVQFAFSTDTFALREATRSKDGSWMITGVEDREFRYFYLVDGKVFIPDCRFREADDFGSANCRYLPGKGRRDEN